MTDTEIVQSYVRTHPECHGGIARATFAYHRNHREKNAHYFAGSWREAECRWCGRSREQVRWDDSPPECAARPEWADQSIESVVAREEVLFAKVLERAKVLAVELDISQLTGASLATLHHTHGIDPSMLECALMELGRGSLPQNLHDEYQAAYEEHRETGKRGQKRVVVIAR